MNNEKYELIETLNNITTDFDVSNIRNYYGLITFLFRILDMEENDTEILITIKTMLSEIINKQECYCECGGDKILNENELDHIYLYQQDKIRYENNNLTKEEMYLNLPYPLKVLMSRYLV